MARYIALESNRLYRLENVFPAIMVIFLSPDRFRRFRDIFRDRNEYFGIIPQRLRRRHGRTFKDH